MTAPRVPAAREELFRCEYLAKDLPGHACLRRQSEHAKVRHPKTYELVESPLPLYGHCATGCEQGREIRAALEGQPAAPPLVEAPAPKLNSDRIWTDEVPDPPLLTERASRFGLTPEDMNRAATRVAEAMLQASRRSRARPPWMPPPTPFKEPGAAELDQLTEEPMESKKVCSVCLTKKLRVDNESGICGECRKAPAAGRAKGAAVLAGVKEPEAKPVRTAPAFPGNATTADAMSAWAKEHGRELGAPPPPRLALAGVPPRPGAPALGADGKVYSVARALPDLAHLDEDALLELRDRIDSELAGRLGHHEQVAQRIRAALTHAKDAAA